MQNTGRVQTKQPILSRRLQTGVTLWPKIGNTIMQVSALCIDPLACAGETRQSVRVFFFFLLKALVCYDMQNMLSESESALLAEFVHSKQTNKTKREDSQRKLKLVQENKNIYTSIHLTL